MASCARVPVTLGFLFSILGAGAWDLNAIKDVVKDKFPNLPIDEKTWQKIEAGANTLNEDKLEGLFQLVEEYTNPNAPKCADTCYNWVNFDCNWQEAACLKQVLEHQMHGEMCADDKCVGCDTCKNMEKAEDTITKLLELMPNSEHIKTLEDAIFHQKWETLMNESMKLVPVEDHAKVQELVEKIEKLAEQGLGAWENEKKFEEKMNKSWKIDEWETMLNESLTMLPEEYQQIIQTIMEQHQEGALRMVDAWERQDWDALLNETLKLVPQEYQKTVQTFVDAHKAAVMSLVQEFAGQDMNMTTLMEKLPQTHKDVLDQIMRAFSGEKWDQPLQTIMELISSIEAATGIQNMTEQATSAIEGLPVGAAVEMANALSQENWTAVLEKVKLAIGEFVPAEYQNMVVNVADAIANKNKDELAAELTKVIDIFVQDAAIKTMMKDVLKALKDEDVEALKKIVEGLIAQLDLPEKVVQVAEEAMEALTTGDASALEQMIQEMLPEEGKIKATEIVGSMMEMDLAEMAQQALALIQEVDEEKLQKFVVEALEALKEGDTEVLFQLLEELLNPNAPKCADACYNWVNFKCNWQEAACLKQVLEHQMHGEMCGKTECGGCDTCPKIVTGPEDTSSPTAQPTHAPTGMPTTAPTEEDSIVSSSNVMSHVSMCFCLLVLGFAQ